jgi:hypothetical protein
VLIGYFDEVKHQPGVQPYEWLAGIFVRDAAIQEVERRLNELAYEAFGTRLLTKKSEFHAAVMLNGSGTWKGRELGTRIQLLKKLALLLGERDLIKRVQVRIDVTRLRTDKEPSELAFMFFVEKANALLKGERDVGLLIGDFEHERVVNKVTEKLSDYRANGTPYDFGQDIDALVDTVHFCRSHHSRLLQLADAYAWFSQLSHGPSGTKEPQKSLVQFASTEADILWPDKFKHWPPS